MINSRLPFRTARKTSRDGFTLVELLVVIGIIAILAGVALGPITSGIEKAKESSAMQSARSINLLCFSYSNDNNQTYPVGAASIDVAKALLNGGYATDPTIFFLQGASKYAGTGAPYADFQPNNISWDFTAGPITPPATTATGLTSAASDSLPVVYCTGENVAYPTTASQGLNLTLSGKGPFKNNGIAVAYKSNSAVFMKGTFTSATQATVNGFISTSDSDTTAYTQVKSGNPLYQ